MRRTARASHVVVSARVLGNVYKHRGVNDLSSLNEALLCGLLGGVVSILSAFPICALAVCEAGLGVTS